jgi:uridine kinase
MLDNNQKYLIIGISGMSGAGKTTLVKALSDSTNATAIYWDDFDPISKSPEDLVEWYHRGKNYAEFDYASLSDVLDTLKSGSTIKHPISNEDLVSTPCIIFDAPMGRLHQQTGRHINIEIYMDTPADIALARRLIRDCEHTLHDKNEIIEELRFYIEKSRPLFFSDDLKNSADLLIDGVLTTKEQIEKIQSYLSKKEQVPKQNSVEQSLRFKVLFSNRINQTMNLLDRMDYYHVKGVSLAVINDGKIDWADTYGIADVENGEKLTTNTLFQAGSISKTITALGILYLVQEGLLSLDEDVNKYLKSWRIPENNFTKNEKVTLRRILSHSAGLTVSGFRV